MNRVKFAPFNSRAEWRSLGGAQLRCPPPPFSAALFMATSSFHSTAVLERKRKTQWHFRFDYYAKRKKNRNRESKRSLFRNISDYAEFLFQSWREEEEQRPTSGPSWFRGHRWVRGTNRNNGFYSGRPHSSANSYRCNGKSAFDSCSSDDEEVETIFRYTFGGERFSYWSFDWRNTSSRNSFSSSRKWSYDSDEDEEDYGPDKTKSETVLAREALGLNISGPLKLEEVKSAYRACALRWHPDRHNGSSKAEAEEKFKHCSAAYKTLYDSLT